MKNRLKMFRSFPRICFSKEQYIDIGYLLAISFVYLGLSLYQIELPGLYGDELDKIAPTVALLHGDDYIWAGKHQTVFGGWYMTIFGARVLLSFNEHIGPVLVYLPMPFILLFGYTPFALRFSSLFCAWLTLIFAYLGVRIWFGKWVARFGIILTAVSPAFVFLQRMGYYNYAPVTLFTSITFFSFPLEIKSSGTAFFVLTRRFMRGSTGKAANVCTNDHVERAMPVRKLPNDNRFMLTQG